MSTARKLQRQLNKAFGSSDFNSECEALLAELADSSNVIPLNRATTRFQEIIKQLPVLLKSVQESYLAYEDRLEMANRNLELSSHELNGLYGKLNLMMDTLDEGLLVFDRQGMCGPIFSNACESLLECIPVGKTICEVLGVPVSEREKLHQWVQLLFQEQIEFDDLADLGPKTYPHSKGRIIRLIYKPVRNQQGQIDSVMMMATDHTAEEEQRRKLQEQMDYVQLVTRISMDRQNFARFVVFVRKFVEELQQPLNHFWSSEALSEIQRRLHTIKGGAMGYGMTSFVKVVHQLESDLQKIRALENGALVNPVILQIQIQLSDQLDRFLSEYDFLISSAQISGLPMREVPVPILQELWRMSSGRKIQHLIEDLIAVPVSELLASHLSSLAILARDLGKARPMVQIVGGELRLEPEPYSDFLASLTHVFRNLIDHGVEWPDERELLGKSRNGQIGVIVKNEVFRGQPGWEIRISDDGRGVDTHRLRRRLVELGQDVSMLSDSEVSQSIFAGRLSTKEEVNALSGRGVGLGATKAEVDRLGGEAEVISHPGKGCEFIFRLPMIRSVS